MCIYMEKNSEKNLVCGENGKYKVCVNHTSENQTTLAAFSVIGKFTYIIFCKLICYFVTKFTTFLWLTQFFCGILSSRLMHFSANFSEQKSSHRQCFRFLDVCVQISVCCHDTRQSKIFIQFVLWYWPSFFQDSGYFQSCPYGYDKITVCTITHCV